MVDSFWGYKGDREDSFYRAAIETALELDAAQYELVPSGSLTEHTLAQFRSFLRDCGVRPRISGQLDYGYHDIIDIVRSEVALDRKEHPVKDVEKVDVPPIARRSSLASKTRRSACRRLSSPFLREAKCE